MVCRTLRSHLVLSLALLPLACGDDATPGATTTVSADGTSSADGMDSVDEGMDEVDTTGDGDGDTTGDGDGDGDTGDGDGDGDPMQCIDLDQDGYGENCDLGPDCDDADFNNHTEEGCANCVDADTDGQWVGCDTFDRNKPGEDCDDNDFNVFTEEGCANCTDEDMDTFWVGCDQYGEDKPGPDCDDTNPVVGLENAEEICNGLSENCAGEIDNVPADLMCPPGDEDAPHVALENGWACEPPAPGEDGCVILNCEDQYFDLDGQYDNGCECAGTTRTKSLAECSFLLPGYLGALGEGEQALDVAVGAIPEIDNGVGAGAEDWYWAEFNENDAVGVRPHTGIIQVSFTQNDNNDYRFEVYDSCEGVVWGNGLATQFGQGAPPALEWWFFDNHVDPMNSNLYAWPETVFIRVFRVQNDQTCSNYQLQVQRADN